MFSNIHTPARVTQTGVFMEVQQGPLHQVIRAKIAEMTKRSIGRLFPSESIPIPLRELNDWAGAAMQLEHALQARDQVPSVAEQKLVMIQNLIDNPLEFTAPNGKGVLRFVTKDDIQHILNTGQMPTDPHDFYAH